MYVLHQLGQTFRQLSADGALRRTMAREGKEVFALVVVESKGSRKRGGDAGRWTRVSRLFQSGQIVDADSGQRGDFFPSQTRGSRRSHAWG